MSNRYLVDTVLRDNIRKHRPRYKKWPVVDSSTDWYDVVKEFKTLEEAEKFCKDNN